MCIVVTPKFSLVWACHKVFHTLSCLRLGWSPVKTWIHLLLLLSHFSRVQLCDPIDGRPLGSPVPGILQARTMEWLAISFSNAWKWKVKRKSLRVCLFATPWTAAYQAPPSMGFSRQEYSSGLPLPSPWIHHIMPNMLFSFTTHWYFSSCLKAFHPQNQG